MHDYEKLGAFYLGRPEDLEADETSDQPLLYDAKDLTTHAVILGMTGSGKTGLGIGLLEEAAIDGIPSIVIDPKGDMSNLLLQFPELRAQDFEPWVDAGTAQRKGKSVPEFAADTAALWKKGIGQWGQEPARIRRLSKAAEFAVYTPGSSSGRPLRLLKSFAAPPPEVRNDPEAFGEAVQGAVASLHAILSMNEDPQQSREGILLANILQHHWSAARSVDLPTLIGEIQKPPFERLGVLDVEAFFPSKDRFKLAMQMNSLLASPGFAAWMDGEPLDIARLFTSKEGKPRVSVLSIAHLDDRERMFFVTMVLNELVSWMRKQGGTSSLRAMLYMDEIYGFFPPSAQPPSKRPMLTLLKQARAFGLGVVLSTQNPVDLDYKGLSNCGTWFLGRLQTERDKARVLDGLEGALSSGGKAFDRSEMDRILSGLGGRVFLMNNVHDDAPIIFRTRWVLSYLRGPMTRQEVQKLIDRDRSSVDAAQESAAVGTTTTATPPPAAPAPAPVAKAAKENATGEKAPPPRTMVPDDVEERFLDVRGDVDNDEALVYRPVLHGRTRLHYARVSLKVDQWQEVDVTLELPDEDDDLDWDEAELTDDPPRLDERKRPEEGARFSALTAEASKKKTWASWRRQFRDHLYRTQIMTFHSCKAYKLLSTPGEEKGDFIARLRQAAREERDEDVEALRAKYKTKLGRLQERLRKAQEKVGKEEEQYRDKKRSSLLRVGESLFKFFTGSKATSTYRTTASSFSSASKEKADIARAERDVASLEEKVDELEQELADEIERIRDEHDLDDFTLEEKPLAPKKTEIATDSLRVLWRPYRVDEDGIATPSW